MTHRLIVFVFMAVETKRHLGYGGIAPDARYISAAWSGASRLDRYYAEPADWRAFESALTKRFPSTPLESTHIAVRLLLPRERRPSVLVQFLTEIIVAVEAPYQAATMLDATLRGFQAGH